MKTFLIRFFYFLYYSLLGLYKWSKEIFQKLFNFVIGNKGYIDFLPEELMFKKKIQNILSNFLKCILWIYAAFVASSYILAFLISKMETGNAALTLELSSSKFDVSQEVFKKYNQIEDRKKNNAKIELSLDKYARLDANSIREMIKISTENKEEGGITLKQIETSMFEGFKAILTGVTSNVSLVDIAIEKIKGLGFNSVAIKQLEYINNEYKFTLEVSE